MQVNKDMLIGELVQMHELIAQGETLEEACMVHGIDCDALVAGMNEVLAERGL